MDAAKIAERDQGIAELVDLLPRVWHGLYLEMQEQGFTPDQAFDLVKEYIHTSCSNHRGE